MPKYLENATAGSTGVARRRMAFTERRIAALPIPKGEQRVYWHDQTVRGLAVAVSPSGKKSYVLYRKISGRPERITIGAVADFTVEQARGEASRLNGTIAQGINPAAERRSVKATMTLGELWDSYRDLYAKEHLRPTTRKNYESIFRNHLDRWRGRNLYDITAADVDALHAKLGRDFGPHTANRTAELLSAMFRRAQRKWGYEGLNPAAIVEAFAEHARKRFLGDKDAKEPARFFKALAKEDQLWQDFFRLCIFTGARCGDVESMAWDAINFLRSRWTLEAETTKGKRAVDIALDAAALEILERRKGNGSKWVFPKPTPQQERTRGREQGRMVTDSRDGQDQGSSYSRFAAYARGIPGSRGRKRASDWQTARPRSGQPGHQSLFRV